MSVSFIKKGFSVALMVGLFSCNNQTNKNQPDTSTIRFNNSLNYSKEEGIIGVFDTPAMLCLGIVDSAGMNEVANKVAQNYRTLEAQVKTLDLQKNGPPGQLIYNNNPKNFKFECLIPIRKMPSGQLKSCNVVALDAGKVLIYNYYGSYEKLYTAYDLIRDFCKLTSLEQNGPMREFYVTDPTVESDPKKLLTRIIVPVKKQE
jgi:effector-binding domain-containing protein